MNKELRDLAWSVLPKEFKEEVKKLYSRFLFTREGYYDELFGKHNLTSDAEGEEMLMVPRKKVQEMFVEAQKATPTCEHDRGFRNAELTILRNLFCSECLPDGTKDGTKELKPAEPEFKAGDIAVVRGFKHPLLEHDGAIVSILSYHEKGDFYSCAIAPNVGIDVDAKYLKPYTEPDTSHETPVCENHSDNTSQKEVNMNSNRNLSQETANCDKQLDNILKDSFSKERRLNIATQMVKAIMQCPEIIDRISSAATDSLLDDILHDALHLTDRLIAECKKGGQNENN